MVDKLKIANGVLVLTLAYDLYAARKKRARYEQILDKNEILHEQIKHAQYMVGYLAKKLEQNEIDLDEFDMIALNNLM